MASQRPPAGPPLRRRPPFSRDWLAREVPQLPGAKEGAFDGDDVNRLLIPDLVGVDGWTLAAAVAALVWLASLEGGLLADAEDGEEGEGGAAGQPPRPQDLPPEQRRAYERRRGLSWLALATALTVWCTGVVNKAPLLGP